MLDLLPESVWNSKTRFLDICCKSGNFLIEIYNRLDRILSSDDNFKDSVKRRKHILENQIYGICTDSFEEMMIKRRMLGDPFSDNENISTIAYVHPVSGASKQFKELAQLSKQKTLKKKEEQLGYLKDAIKEKFKRMDFDVVVGNPPYNNDMYLDFVMIGHELAKQFTLMITPAKWQAKGGGQNDLFRKTIVPYMSKIVYYPDAFELFNIREQEGITYFIIDNHLHNEKYIDVRCRDNKAFESCEIRNDISLTLYGGGFNSIIRKFSAGKMLSTVINDKSSTFLGLTDYGNVIGDIRVLAGEKISGYVSRSDLKTLKGLDKFKVTTNIMPVDVGFDKNGQLFGLSRTYILEPNDVPKGSFIDLIHFDTKEQALSFQSYCNARPIRFLYFVGICGKAMNRRFWRFVPDPGAFDHIFTDEELYKKYNLTDDEIKLIESVIKERK